jgi:hypothetical protein
MRRRSDLELPILVGGDNPDLRALPGILELYKPPQHQRRALPGKGIVINTILTTIIILLVVVVVISSSYNHHHHTSSTPLRNTILYVYGPGAGTCPGQVQYCSRRWRSQAATHELYDMTTSTDSLKSTWNLDQREGEGLVYLSGSG